MAGEDGITLRDLTGDALSAALDALADLRIAIFRDFPYLYDGDRQYERAYLTAYAASPGAYIVGAFVKDRMVGAATAAPMAHHAAELAAPLHARGIDITQICYFGESVLLPAYRGRGIGHAFFDRREAAARADGFAIAAFCAVVRPPDHPDRPAGYSPLDPFWCKRGFTPVEGVIGHLDWKDTGEAEESPHPMQFWMKTL